MHAGEPAQPVQQSVVMASMRGFFFRVALPSPSDMGHCFSTMSYMGTVVRIQKSEFRSHDSEVSSEKQQSELLLLTPEF